MRITCALGTKWISEGIEVSLLKGDLVETETTEADKFDISLWVGVQSRRCRSIRPCVRVRRRRHHYPPEAARLNEFY